MQAVARYGVKGGPTEVETVPLAPQSLEGGLVLYRSELSFGTLGLVPAPDGGVRVLPPRGWSVGRTDAIGPMGDCPCRVEAVYNDGANAILVVAGRGGTIVQSFVLTRQQG